MQAMEGGGWWCLGSGLTTNSKQGKPKREVKWRGKYSNPLQSISQIMSCMILSV